jgi:hypothetical protein
MLDWRYEEALPLCEEALAMARPSCPRAGPGTVLAYLGRATRASPSCAAGWSSPTATAGAAAAYIALTDVLLMLGRRASRPAWRPRRTTRCGAPGSTTPRWSPTGSRRWSRPGSGTRPTASAPPPSVRSPPTTRTCD